MPFQIIEQIFDKMIAFKSASCYNGHNKSLCRRLFMATRKQMETVAPAADKKKALEAALGQIERQFGKGSVMRLGENANMQVDHIPTGSIGLDLALGIGGLPRGRIVEIYGPESSGKTTVALHCVAEAQKNGRHRRLYRRGARARPGLRQGAGRGHRQPARLPAGHRRAGSGHRRGTRALGRDRHRGHRLGRCAHPARRDRGRDGRLVRRPARPHDEQAMRKLAGSISKSTAWRSSSTSCAKRSA